MIRAVTFAGALLLLTVACGPDDESLPPILRDRAGDSEAVRYAKKDKWQLLCASCHGLEGRGDGPSSWSLDPRPRSFHDEDWHATVDDDHIRKIIVEGGQAVGKSGHMPPSPELADMPESLDYLVAIVRSFGG